MVDHLGRTELEVYKKTARKLTGSEAEFPFTIIPYTGLTPQEFLHLREDWILWGNGDALEEDRPPVIRIPERADCRNLRWDPNPPYYVRRDTPCNLCEEYGGTDQWECDGESNARDIPVIQPEAQVELERWFQTLSYDGVPYTYGGLESLVRRVRKRSPLNHEFGFTTLRHTFIHICAEQGVEKDLLRQIIPHERIQGSVRSILADSSTDYDVEITVKERLPEIQNQEPVTAVQLAEALDTGPRNERQWLNSLEEIGIVESVGKVETAKLGRNPTGYRLAEDATVDARIPCSHPTCSREFLTFRGLSNHETTVHND